MTNVELAAALETVTGIAARNDWTQEWMDREAEIAVARFAPGARISWNAEDMEYEVKPAPVQPPLTVDQAYGYLIEGKFKLFKNDKMTWDAYMGASGDDAFYGTGDGWIYILSRENNNMSAEFMSADDATAANFTVQFGAWEEV